MSASDTTPRIVLRNAGGAEDGAGILIFAGYAFDEPIGDRPRLTSVSQELTFGRDPAADVAMDFDDPFMSRQHARIGRSPHGGYWVRDLGSTNGTWVDGVRLPAGGQHRLRDGAILMMGGQVFVFRRVTEDEVMAIHEDCRNPLALAGTLSPQLALLTRKLRRLAPSQVDLLLTGETGVGKEIHAEAIHRASGRRGPFIAINCAALPENLVESELFGYARGAHSTADRPKAGLLEQAHGGTLFLDEIGEMPSTAQTKLLRFLQSREILSLGSTKARSLDVRVIAATHRAVAADENSEGLRYDLAARLGPEPLTLPPLRDRPEDIGNLASALLGGPASFEPEAYLSLFLHTWKGNVRELDKVLAVARVLANGCPAIDLEHLPREISARVESRARPGRSRRKRPTREELMSLLARHAGDVARVAREIGRQRTLVWRWLREDAVKVEDFR